MAMMSTLSMRNGDIITPCANWAAVSGIPGSAKITYDYDISVTYTV